MPRTPQRGLGDHRRRAPAALVEQRHLAEGVARAEGRPALAVASRRGRCRRRSRRTRHRPRPLRPPRRPCRTVVPWRPCDGGQLLVGQTVEQRYSREDLDTRVGHADTSIAGSGGAQLSRDSSEWLALAARVAYSGRSGEVSELVKERDWKSRKRVQPASRVRIPPSPLVEPGNRSARTGGKTARMALRVLIVDDDTAIVRMLERTLRAGEGYDTARSADGGGALARAESWAPDAIVLDVMMPGVDGLVVARGACATGGAVPVLLLTARDPLRDRVAGLEAGADHYLVKPFADDELTRGCARLRRRRDRRPSLLRGLRSIPHARRRRGASALELTARGRPAARSSPQPRPVVAASMRSTRSGAADASHRQHPLPLRRPPAGSWARRRSSTPCAASASSCADEETGSSAPGWRWRRPSRSSSPLPWSASRSRCCSPATSATSWTPP